MERAHKIAIFIFAIIMIVAVSLFFFIGSEATGANIKNPFSDKEQKENFETEEDSETAADDDLIYDDEGSLTADGGGSTSEESSQIEEQPYYYGNDCGVTKQVNDYENLNLSEDLTETQQIILECMGNSLPSCSNARMMFVLENGAQNNFYEISGMAETSCTISGPDSSGNVVYCGFSESAMDYLFDKAIQDYPNLEAAKFFYILKVIRNGGDSIISKDGLLEVVECS